MLLLLLLLFLDVVSAGWPTMSVSVLYGGCANSNWALCMCVGTKCHSVGDYSTMQVSLLNGQLVYNFSTILDLSPHGGRVNFDGELCEGRLWESIVTHRCNDSKAAGWTEILQYDTDRCRMIVEAEREGPCQWWRTLVNNEKYEAEVLPTDPYHRAAIVEGEIVMNAMHELRHFPVHLTTRTSERLASLAVLNKKRSSSKKKAAQLSFALLALHVTRESIPRARKAIEAIPESKVTIILFVSGGVQLPEKENPWLKNTIVIYVGDKEKWWCIKHFLTDGVVKGFESLLLWSHEIDASNTNMALLLKTVKVHNMDLAAPSVSHQSGCYVGSMLQRFGLQGRFTDLIEFGAVVVSTKVWNCFRSMILDDLKYGYGYELVAPSYCSLNRIGIVDATSVDVACLTEDYNRQIAKQEIAEVLNVRYPNVAVGSWRILSELPSGDVVPVSSLPSPADAMLHYYHHTDLKTVESVFDVASQLSSWSQITRSMLDNTAKKLVNWDPCATKENVGMMKKGLRCIDIRGSFKAILVNQKLFIKELAASYQSRGRSGMHLILETINFARISKNYLTNDPVEILISTGDHPIAKRKTAATLSPILSIATHEAFSDVGFPCFSFWDWTETNIAGWVQQQSRMLNAAAQFPYSQRIPRMFWRGSDNGKFTDEITGEVQGKRRPLIALSRQYAGSIDAKFTSSKSPLQQVSLEDHCRYKYLINIAGATYSARLKYLLLCGSTLFHVVDPHQEFFQQQLLPNVHFIPVKADMSDLISQLQWAIDHPKDAERIGLQGQQFVQKNMEMKQVLSYTLDLVNGLAKLQKNMQPDINGAIEINSHDDIEKNF